jgi:hypothetical protein
MTNYRNWEELINSLLTKNGQFKVIDTSQKADTTLEFYQQQIGDKETIIKVGYLKNGRLVTIDISNPKSPGHNAEQIEYFGENDFDESKRFGSVGLTFSEVNQKAIISILTTGLRGTEKKYYKNGILQFSKIEIPIGENEELFVETHYFKEKNFWFRLLKKMIRKNQEYDIEEIELKSKFRGIK